MERIVRPMLFMGIILLVAIGFAAVVHVSETDNGDDPKTAGICRDTWENRDVCLADVLLEFYKNGSQCSYAFHNCPNEFTGKVCRETVNGMGYCG